MTNPDQDEADVPKGTCSIEDCDTKEQSRTWCAMHYARWLRYGSPHHVPLRKKDMPCGADGCERRQRLNGWCEMHDRRVKKFGTPEGRRWEQRPCSGPECVRLVDERSVLGLCSAHYRQHQLGNELAPLRIAQPDRPPLCQFPECGRKNKVGGLCAAHVLQQKRGQQLRPIKTPNKVWGPCIVEQCDQTRVAFDYCERHYSLRVRRWKRYGLTPSDGDELYRRQRQRCGACLRAVDIDSLHIDHDHECCTPGKRGCGHCVRGLLCSTCNTGLGYFADNPQRLRRAAAYLDRYAAAT